MEVLKLNYFPDTFLLNSMPDTIVAEHLNTYVKLKVTKTVSEFKYENQGRVREIYEF